MSGIAIRAEREEDRAAVRRVVERAFGGGDEADLVARLHRDGDAIVACVAVADGAVVGHVLFSRLRVDGGHAPLAAASLAPLAVLPAMQRRGIGSALVRHGLEACRAAAVDAVFVLGEPAYYARFGFDSAPARQFASPFPVDAFMALALRPGALDGASGTLRFAPAFGLAG